MMKEFCQEQYMTAPTRSLNTTNTIFGEINPCSLTQSSSGHTACTALQAWKSGSPEIRLLIKVFSVLPVNSSLPVFFASLSDIHLYLRTASETQSMQLTWLWHCISHVYTDPLQACDLNEWVALALESANPPVFWGRSLCLKMQWPTSLMVRI